MVERNSPEAARWLLGSACISYLVQLAWFAPKCFHQIDADGMGYVGIAQHWREGDFHAAINAFRSPLVSWLIAAGSYGNSSYLRVGKLISIFSFVLCMALLHIFAMSLWRSRTVAALAVLLLTLGRGLVALSIAMVTPDFLFADVVLLYFLLLLHSFRKERLRGWWWLGLVQGVAFLAKGFALPWLGVCTLAACWLSSTSWKVRGIRLGAALIIPVLVAAGWAAVLQSKYGVYTAGSQFRTNLLQWVLREYPAHEAETYALLRDTANQLDGIMVGDPMPPGSWAWSYRVNWVAALPKLIEAEGRNLPKALKEMTMVVTPGAGIAFAICVGILFSRRKLAPAEWRIAAVAGVSVLTLFLAYCMLVFDERYLFPVIPLVLAIGSRFLVADPEFKLEVWRKTSVALVIAGTAVALFYHASPFRILTRDFQASSYAAGDILRERSQAGRIVSIGEGPFPQFGMGWESGYQAAYFGGGRLIATLDAVPVSGQFGALMDDLKSAAPNTVLIWGKPEDNRFIALLTELSSNYPASSMKSIADPMLGEVGVVFFTSR